MKRLFILLTVLILAAFAGNGYAETFEKDDALWREAKTLAKAGKIDEALAKTGEMSPARKETVLNMIAVIAADDFQNYDKALEIGKTLSQAERREYLWLYIPRSAAANQDYDGFIAVVQKTKLLVLDEYLRMYFDKENVAETMKFIEEAANIYLNALYRDAAVIYANRGLLRENVKVIKLLDRETNYYKSAVTATVIEVMNGLHSQPEALDGYLAELNYRKVRYLKKIGYGGAVRHIIAYDTPNTVQFPDILILLLYDETGEKIFLTALFLDKELTPYLTE